MLSKPEIPWMCINALREKYFIYLSVSSISIAPLQFTIFSEALPTTARTLCWSFHAEAQRAIVSEGLVQGSYVAPIGRGSNPRRYDRWQTNVPTVPPRLTVLGAAL